MLLSIHSTIVQSKKVVILDNIHKLHQSGHFEMYPNEPYHNNSRLSELVFPVPCYVTFYCKKRENF